MPGNQTHLRYVLPLCILFDSGCRWYALLKLHYRASLIYRSRFVDLLVPILVILVPERTTTGTLYHHSGHRLLVTTYLTDCPP